ncbi:MAG: DNA repair protein RecN, partial [Flavobacteriales bacterium]
MHKHNVQSIGELKALKTEIKNKLESITNTGSKINYLESKRDELRSKLEESAHKLSEKRKKAIPSIEKKVDQHISSMKMKNSRIKIEHQISDEIGKTGKDRIKFLLSGNKGNEFKEITKVASGGEYSRIMLAIKATLSEKNDLPSIVLDEIDTGISGETADKAGEVLKNMANRAQLITITHLPQIASKADYHLKAYKMSKKNKNYSYMEYLQESERIKEVARLLSGEEMTDAA